MTEFEEENFAKIRRNLVCTSALIIFYCLAGAELTLGKVDFLWGTFTIKNIDFFLPSVWAVFIYFTLRYISQASVQSELLTFRNARARNFLDKSDKSFELYLEKQIRHLKKLGIHINSEDIGWKRVSGQPKDGEYIFEASESSAWLTHAFSYLITKRPIITGLSEANQKKYTQYIPKYIKYPAHKKIAARVSSLFSVATTQKQFLETIFPFIIACFAFSNLFFISFSDTAIELFIANYNTTFLN